MLSSPPWGGSKFKNKKTFLLSDLPVDGNEIFRISKQLTDNIAFYLPRNQDRDELSRLNVPCSVYEHNIHRFGSTLSVFFGDLIDYDRLVQASKPPTRYPPAIRFTDELNLNLTRSDSFDAGSMITDSRPNKTSPIDSEVNDAVKNSEHPNDDKNCSGTRLRDDSNNNVLNSNKANKGKNIFQKAKRMKIAKVLKEKKCCLM